MTPPGAANFTLNAQANNQNNPNVKPQESTNFEVGAKWDLADGRLSLNRRGVPHGQQERHLHRRRDRDAAGLQPGRRAARERRHGRRRSAGSPRAGRCWRTSRTSTRALESQNPSTNGNRLTLTPEFSGSVWTTYRLPGSDSRSAAASARPMTSSSTRPTRFRSPGYHLVDALVEYEVNRHLTLRLNIYNLTDETYIRNVNNNGGRYNPGTAARGAPDLERHVLARTCCQEGVSMLLTIPDVLTRDQVAEARDHLARADWVDGRVTAGYQSVAGQGQPATAGRSSRGARPGRDDPRGAAAQSALHLGGPASADLSAALQPVRGRTSRSAATSTMPSARSPAPVSGFARTFPPPSF